MARLKNLKKEAFAQAVIASGGNKTKAYLATHADAKYTTAQSTSYKLWSDKDVRSRVYELLARTRGARLKTLIDKLVVQTDAKKSVVVDKLLAEVADNNARQSAIITLLRLWGLLGNNGSPLIDARSVSLNVDAVGESRLNAIADALSSLNARLLATPDDNLQEPS